VAFHPGIKTTGTGVLMQETGVAWAIVPGLVDQQ
jgi:hypothetical protein